jgi:hypothetical protein
VALVISLKRRQLNTMLSNLTGDFTRIKSRSRMMAAPPQWTRLMWSEKKSTVTLDITEYGTSTAQEVSKNKVQFHRFCLMVLF